VAVPSPSLNAQSYNRQPSSHSIHHLNINSNDRYHAEQLDSQFASFAATAGCPSPSLACLRALGSAELQNSNLIETNKAKYGHFQFGPAVDGTYVQDLPGRELLNGRFAKGVQIMVGHNRYSFLWSG
jgi:hypothetical protein